MVEQLTRHHSQRLQGLPLDSPPTVEGQEGVNMEQPTSANVPVGTALASETREYFIVYTNPLVQLPPVADASMHSPLEGRINSPTPPYYGPDSPF